MPRRQASIRNGCINKQEEGSRPFGKEFVEPPPQAKFSIIFEIMAFFQELAVVERNFVPMETRSNRIRGNIIVDSFNKILILHRF